MRILPAELLFTVPAPASSTDSHHRSHSCSSGATVIQLGRSTMLGTGPAGSAPCLPGAPQTLPGELISSLLGGLTGSLWRREHPQEQRSWCDTRMVAGPRGPLKWFLALKVPSLLVVGSCQGCHSWADAKCTKGHWERGVRCDRLSLQLRSAACVTLCFQAMYQDSSFPADPRSGS